MAQDTLVMPAYVDHLTVALKKTFNGAEVSVEQVRGDRYRFIVLWQGFDPLGHPERQELVWDLADQTLDKADLRKVTMILTVGFDDLPRE